MIFTLENFIELSIETFAHHIFSEKKQTWILTENIQVRTDELFSLIEIRFLLVF